MKSDMTVMKSDMTVMKSDIAGTQNDTATLLGKVGHLSTRISEVQLSIGPSVRRALQNQRWDAKRVQKLASKGTTVLTSRDGSLSCHASRACPRCQTVEMAAHCFQSGLLSWLAACSSWRREGKRLMGPWLPEYGAVYCLMPLLIEPERDYALALVVLHSDLVYCPEHSFEQVGSSLHLAVCLRRGIVRDALTAFAASPVCDDNKYETASFDSNVHAALGTWQHQAVHSAVLPDEEVDIVARESEMKQSGAAFGSTFSLLMPEDAQDANAQLHAASQRTVDGVRYTLLTRGVYVAIPSVRGCSGAIGMQFRQSLQPDTDGRWDLCGEATHVLSGGHVNVPGSTLFSTLSAPRTRRSVAVMCLEYIQRMHEEPGRLGLASAVLVDQCSWHLQRVKPAPMLGGVTLLTDEKSHEVSAQ